MEADEDLQSSICIPVIFGLPSDQFLEPRVNMLQINAAEEAMHRMLSMVDANVASNYV